MPVFSISSDDVDSTLMISTSWSTPESPGNIGCPNNSSATTQPALHTSEIVQFNRLRWAKIYLLMDKKLHDQAQRTILKFSLSYIKRKKNFKMSYKTRCTITQRTCNASRNNRSFILRSVLCIIVDSCITYINALWIRI